MIPSTIMLQKKEAIMTTQPHPPSGGTTCGGPSSESSSTISPFFISFISTDLLAIFHELHSRKKRQFCKLREERNNSTTDHFEATCVSKTRKFVRNKGIMFVKETTQRNASRRAPRLTRLGSPSCLSVKRFRWVSTPPSTPYCARLPQLIFLIATALLCQLS